MKRIFYEGESKSLKRMAELLNRKPETGEGHGDAYYGDYSKEAYEHSQLRSGNPHNINASEVGAADTNGVLPAGAVINVQSLIDEITDRVKSELAASLDQDIADGHQISIVAADGTVLSTVTVPDNNTTYTAGTGLSLSSGNEFSLTNSGVTAGTYGPSGNVTGSNNATMSVPEITVDAKGRVTNVTDRTYTAKNTWTAMAGATSSAAGTAGYVPAPAAGAQAKFLRGDGGWHTPTNTWTAMTGATSSANGGKGYINAVPPSDGYNTKYWRADGTWSVPPNTNTWRGIQDNLTSTSSTESLSAQQGKVLSERFYYNNESTFIGRFREPGSTTSRGLYQKLVKVYFPFSITDLEDTFNFTSFSSLGLPTNAVYMWIADSFYNQNNTFGPAAQTWGGGMYINYVTVDMPNRRIIACSNRATRAGTPVYLLIRYCL